MRKTLLLSFALAVTSTAASAQLAPDQGNVGVYAHTVTYGAYDGKTTGFSPMIADGFYKFWCVDAGGAEPWINNAGSTPTDSYMATAFTTNSASKKGNGVYSSTRQGSQDKYLRAAWLIEKYESGTGGAAFTAKNVQYTIWDMMGTNLSGYTDLNNSTYLAANYASTLTRDWFVLTDTPIAQGDNQEYLMYTSKPAISTVPEPSTYALMGAGLLALGFASRRRRRVTA
jgi:hypothetical protein